MHDAALVRGSQPQQRALQHDQRRLGRGRALVGQDLAQRDSLDQFHHDRRTVRRLDILIQPDHVRVLDRRQRGSFTAEHLGEHRVAQQVGAQVLDGDQHTGGVVPGENDPAEPARAEVFELGVAGNGPLGHRDPPLISVAPAREARRRSMAVRELAAALAAGLVQQLSATRVDAVRRLGLSTCRTAVLVAEPWPLPSTATVTSTARCPLVTDWRSVVACCAPGLNSHR
jgi:hypothetical protein